MTTDQFIDWVQKVFDSCNVHNEIEVSKLIVEVMRKFHSINKDNLEQVIVRPILR